MKVTRPKALLALVLAGLLGVGLATKPVAETVLTPIVKEQVNKSINGSVQYEAFHIHGDGSVSLDDMVLFDQGGKQVASADEVRVSLGMDSLRAALEGSRSVGLISEVTLQKPHVHLEREDDGSWNLTHIIKEKDNTAKEAFQGSITLDDGQVAITENQDELLEVDRINGSMSFADSAYIDGAIRGELEGQNVLFRGQVALDDFNLKGYVEANQIQASLINRILQKEAVLPAGQELILREGSIDAIHLNIDTSQSDMGLMGSLEINNLSGSYRDGSSHSDKPTYHFAHVNSSLTLSNGRLHIHNAYGQVENQNVTLTGLLGLGGDHSLNLTIKGNALDGARIGQLFNQNVEGQFTLDAHLSGSVSNPIVMGQVYGQDVAYDGYHIDSLKGKILYQADELLISSMTLNRGNSSLNGKGSINVNSRDFSLELDSLGFELSDLGSLLNQSGLEEVSGSIQGHAVLQGKDGNLDALDARVTGRAITYEGVTVDALDARLLGDQGHYDLVYAKADIGSGAVNLSGAFTNDTVDLTFTGSSIDASMMSDYLGQAVTGAVTITGQVTGALDNPMASAHITSQALSVAEFKAGVLDSRIRLQDKKVLIDKAYLGTRTGSYTLTGSYGLDDGLMDIWVGTDTTRLENIASSLTDVPLTGWISSKNHITGSKENPNIRGYIHLWDGSIEGQLYSDINAQYALQNGILQVPTLRAEAYGATIMGSGSLDRNHNNALYFNFTGDQVALRPWIPNNKLEVDGYLAFQGTLKGTLEEPVFTGVARSRQISINEEPLESIEGRIYIDKSVLQLDNLSFQDDGGGHYQLKGGMSFQNHNLFGNLTVEGGNIRHLIDLMVASDAKEENSEFVSGEGKDGDELGESDDSTALLDTTGWTGRLDGSIDLGGSLENPSLVVKGAIQDIAYGGQLIGSGELDATLANRRLHLTKLALPVDNGMIAAGGTIDFQGDADMQIAINAVDLTRFSTLFPEGSQITGTGYLVLNIMGKTKNPRMELSAEIANASYHGVGLDHLYALATMEDQVINIQQVMGMKGPYVARAYGKIPLAAFYTSGYLDASDAKSMDVVVDLNKADFAVLPLLTPYVTKGEGPLAGVVHITGTIDQPQASGQVSVRNGLLGFKYIDNELQDINADVLFQGSQVSLQGQGQMGKGSMGINGMITWAGHQVTSYQGALQMDQFEVKSDYTDGPISGELYVTEKDGTPTLSGQIDLEHNRFTLPLTLESGDGEMPLALDVNVHAGKGVRLYDKFLYDMTITGDVHFLGNTYWPRPSGQFTVSNGTFKYLNNSFRIVEGKANFRQGSYLPSLNLQAETNSGDYTIYLGVSGTVDALDMTLTSNPALSRQRIVSLLTFGKSTESNSTSLTGEDANSLLVSGANMLVFGYVEDALKSNLKLDLINITSASLDPDEPINKETAGNYNIEIGKYIIPNLMVTYSTGINNSSKRYGIRYRLSKKLSMNAWHTSEKHSFVGLQYKNTFSY